MDPNMFAVDWAQLTEGLTIIIVLSFFVERALALILESPPIQKLLSGKALIKELLALGLAYAICAKTDFDILAIMLHQPETDYFGLVMTAAVIAGGSKASIKLFHDILGVKPKQTPTPTLSPTVIKP